MVVVSEPTGLDTVIPTFFFASLTAFMSSGPAVP